MTPQADCRGPIPFGSTGRRAFLQTGLAGFASLTLPGIFKLQSQSRANSSTSNAEKKAVIMVWQPGGLSHLDSYDPKPESGSDYRGPFNLISTKVPGLQFTELMPRQAAIARCGNQRGAILLAPCNFCQATPIPAINRSRNTLTG
jgi:hypothetical protein